MVNFVRYTVHLGANCEGSLSMLARSAGSPTGVLWRGCRVTFRCARYKLTYGAFGWQQLSTCEVLDGRAHVSQQTR